jgi:hypothetical protein
MNADVTGGDISALVAAFACLIEVVAFPRVAEQVLGLLRARDGKVSPKTLAIPPPMLNGGAINTKGLGDGPVICSILDLTCLGAGDVTQTDGDILSLYRPPLRPTPNSSPPNRIVNG